MGSRLFDVFSMFIVDKETYCSPVTIANYYKNLGYFFDYINCRFGSWEDFLVEDITLQLLNEYVAQLRLRKKCSKNSDESLIRKRTVRTYCIDLRTFLKWMYDNDFVQEDFCKKFKLIKAEKAVVMPLNQSEVAAVDSCFNLKTMYGIRNYIVFHLMLDCGLRRSEVVNLRFSDCDFARKLLVIYDGKGSKDRMVPLPSRLIHSLQLYNLRYRPYSSNDYVLVDASGNHCNFNAVKMVFQRLKKSSGVERLHPHLLRHTFATSYLLCGGDVAFLQILLGHSSLDITSNYLHLAQQLSICTNDFYRLDKCFYERMEKI